MTGSPLDMLGSPSVASIPSITGGHAGPSSADSVFDYNFYAPFSVVGSGGGNANATSSPGMQMGAGTIITVSAIVGAALLLKGKL